MERNGIRPPLIHTSKAEDAKSDQKGAANNPLARDKFDQSQWMEASPIELANLLRVAKGRKAMLRIPEKIWRE
jgi:hypothetical protein